jgi:hypothetical protein
MNVRKTVGIHTILRDERIPAKYRELIEELDSEAKQEFMTELSERLTNHLELGLIEIDDSETIKGIIKLIRNTLHNYTEQTELLILKGMLK